MNLSKLQQEIGEWGEENFGKQPSWTSIHGIVEEIGELLETDGDEESEEDAIGDCMIFIVHFCHQSDRDFEVVWNMRQRVRQRGEERLLIVLGKLCRHHLKLFQGIRGSASEHNAEIDLALAQLVGRLSAFAGTDEELLRITQETWERVSKRDWMMDPQNGGES